MRSELHKKTSLRSIIFMYYLFENSLFNKTKYFYFFGTKAADLLGGIEGFYR
jgi:hypothetical protein